jgi:hypothetical protein
VIPDVAEALQSWIPAPGRKRSSHVTGLRDGQRTPALFALERNRLLLVMDADQLGRIVRLDPRKVWQHEALDFTPWLGEHIGELAEKIGVELEIDGSEQAVGAFAADLIGRDVTTGAGLLIENQLEPTDHSHLGQIITYAAGLDTRVMVWISTDVREEHRQAIDWLNEATREDYYFFAVRLELIQISGQVAPDFVIVASPNTWQKRLKAASQSVRATAREERYREIWGLFIEKLRAADRSATRARTGPNGNWFTTQGGFPGGFVVTFSRQGPRVETYLDYDDAERTKQVFDALQARKVDIEAALGHELSWERLDDKRASRIAVYTQGSAQNEGDDLDRLLNWLVDRLLAFRSVFPPFITAAESTPVRAAAVDAEPSPAANA